MGYNNPVPAVDLIIEIEGKGLVLIERRNPPPGLGVAGWVRGGGRDPGTGSGP